MNIFLLKMVPTNRPTRVGVNISFFKFKVAGTINSKGKYAPTSIILVMIIISRLVIILSNKKHAGVSATSWCNAKSHRQPIRYNSCLVLKIDNKMTIYKISIRKLNVSVSSFTEVVFAPSNRMCTICYRCLHTNTAIS